MAPADASSGVWRDGLGRCMERNPHSKMQRTHRMARISAPLRGWLLRGAGRRDGRRGSVAYDDFAFTGVAFRGCAFRSLALLFFFFLGFLGEFTLTLCKIVVWLGQWVAFLNDRSG